MAGSKGSTQILALAEDADWCRSVVWSADSAAVAYLIQDARALVVRAEDGHIIADRWLIPSTGSYPPRRVVKHFRLESKGRSATYVSCDRRNGSHASSSTITAQELYDDEVSDCRSETVTF